jgi:putative DNA primase/helicase
VNDEIEFAPHLPDVVPELRLRALADVKPRQVLWLVPGLIPLRTLTLVAGVGGLGKSTYLAGVAAQVSSGKLGDPADVIFVSLEDPAAEVIRPRVEAAGGDLRRVHELVVGEGYETLRLPTDTDDLAQLVQDVTARLVIIDPIVAAIETDYDSHKDQHVRAVLARLAAIAEKHTCAIPMVGHLNKAPSKDAYLRVANSVAFWNASRSVVLVTEDSNEPDEHRLVAQRKNNWSRMRPVERHRIETIILPDTVDAETGKPIETSRMVFVEIADDVDGADVLAPSERAGKTGEAEDWLEAALDDGGWHDSAGLKKLARFSERTLKRAAQELRVEADRRGFPSVTYWRLPQSGRPSPNESGPTVGTAQLSQEQAATEPVGPTLGDDPTGGPTAPIILVGDPGYSLLVHRAYLNGNLTESERRDRLDLSDRIYRQREEEE